MKDYVGVSDHGEVKDQVEVEVKGTPSCMTIDLSVGPDAIWRLRDWKRNGDSLTTSGAQPR